MDSCPWQNFIMPILNFSDDDPLTDGRQSDRAMEIRRGVVRHFQKLAIAIVAELPLASGRRADIIGLDRRGNFFIVEIKSSVADFRADSKWPEYLGFCDAFFFATHPDVPAEIFPEDHGLIVADGYGAEIIRPAQEQKMAGATRRALTLRFARSAAHRLERVLAHCEITGREMPEDLVVGGDD
jgi:hypothetical protein